MDVSENKELKKLIFKCPQPKLRYLDASGCTLRSLTVPAGCKKLETLYLHKNQITEITFGGDCPSLELLDLSENRLTELELPYRFKELGNLFLQNNKLVDLTSLGEFFIRKDFDFVIEGNEGLQVPPRSIIEQGEEAVKNYFVLLEKEKEDEETPLYNFEVKLLIIGEGGTGKTTLLRKLQDENADMPKKADTTKGIAIEKWKFGFDRDRFRNL